jgi:hypothetical protein
VEDILQHLSCVNKGKHLDHRETSRSERKIGVVYSIRVELVSQREFCSAQYLSTEIRGNNLEGEMPDKLHSNMNYYYVG